MAYIFISYRRSDNAVGYSRSLAVALRREFGSRQVFRDIKSIPPGEDFASYIARTLEGCRVMLVLIGTRWLDAADEHGARRLDDARDWVRREVATALARDTLVIPVLLCGARIPAADELPDDLAGLASRNAFVMSDDDWEHDLAQLVAALRERLDLPARASEQGPSGQSLPDVLERVARRLPRDLPARRAPGALRALVNALLGWLRVATVAAAIGWIAYTQNDQFAAAVERFFRRSAEMLARLVP